MVQVRCFADVQYGHFADVIRCYEELNEICRSRGWKPFQLLVQSGGPMNRFGTCVDYDSMEHWQQEQTEAQSDPEYMKVLRQAAPYCVQGTASEEIWLEAPHLA